MNNSQNATQQKQRQYAAIASTMRNISRELQITRDGLDITAEHVQSMGKLGAMHAAQMMAVERVEEYLEEHGKLPNDHKVSENTTLTAESSSKKT